MRFLPCRLILTQHTFLFPSWRNFKCLASNLIYLLQLGKLFNFVSLLPSTRVSKTMSIARGESILQTWLWTTNSKLNFFQNKPSGCCEIIAEWTGRSSPSLASDLPETCLAWESELEGYNEGRCKMRLKGRSRPPYSSRGLWSVWGSACGCSVTVASAAALILRWAAMPAWASCSVVHLDSAVPSHFSKNGCNKGREWTTPLAQLLVPGCTDLTRADWSSLWRRGSGGKTQYTAHWPLSVNSLGKC